MSEEKSVINVGTRKSALAMVQTHKVVEWLTAAHPSLTFNIITMETIGDKIQDVALSKIGEKSLFTKELEIALEAKEIDLIVHSLKDLPSVLPPNMKIGAICERDDPFDCILFHPKHKEANPHIALGSLPEGSVVGSSSIRRVAQLKRNFPQLKFADIRGNVNTRLKKLEEDNVYDAIVLAKAGIDRMKWQEKVGQVLTSNECFYAIGQGAMAVEIRENDPVIQQLVLTVNHTSSEYCCKAERILMRTLEGGCSVPLACKSTYNENTKTLELEGACFSLNGAQKVHFKQSAVVSSVIQAEELGKAVAEAMITAGAQPLLTAAKAQNKLNINAKPEK